MVKIAQRLRLWGAGSINQNAPLRVVAGTLSLLQDHEVYKHIQSVWSKSEIQPKNVHIGELTN
jgi:hypothetical protein